MAERAMTGSMDAAAWFAVLRRGLMTQDERAAFALWRSEPANARALDALVRLWDELEVARSAYQDNHVETGPDVRVASFSRPARLAAVLTAASIMVGAIYRLDGPWWTALDWWSR